MWEFRALKSECGGSVCWSNNKIIDGRDLSSNNVSRAGVLANVLQNFRCRSLLVLPVLPVGWLCVLPGLSSAKQAQGNELNFKMNRIQHMNLSKACTDNGNSLTESC